MSNKVNICGINIDIVDYNDVLEACISMIYRPGENTLFTPNVDFIVKAVKDIKFRNVLNSADYIVPDGMPLIWASKLLGTPLKEKISGSSLFFKICKIGNQKSIRIFLLGGLPGAAKRAMFRLNKRYGDVVCGYYCPKYGFEKDSMEMEKIISILKNSNSDILIVGLGAPKQEYFIQKYKGQYKIPVSLALGGTIDFASGMREMAPEIFKKNGLGWLWRLVHEPKRLWKRYLIDDMKFFYYILQQKLGLKDFSE